MRPKEKKPLSKFVGIPVNAAFQGHDCYSMLTENVGGIDLNACGGTWRKCGVCCVSCSVTGPFPLSPWGPLESGAQAIHPREHRWFACHGNPGSRIIQWICFPDLYPSDGNHYLLDWTSLVFFISVNKQVLHPAGHLNSNWNISPYICKSKCLFSFWTREMQCLTMQE